MRNAEPCQCPDAGEIIGDLNEDDLLALAEGERLWKLYCFRAAGHATNLRHRIYTKRKTDARLAMVTFAAHNPIDPEEGEPRVVRSAVARVPDLSAADLDRLIDAMRGQSGREACEEIDLSRFESLDAQWAWLRERQVR